jgi:hypothetical protein
MTDKMLVIETGGIFIVVETIAALAPHEFNGKTQVMLISGAEIETDETAMEILSKIAEALRQAHE